jgi:hypothetical protein
VVSYCYTPRLVAEPFDDFGPGSLEPLAGITRDYRERLTDKDLGLVLRLECLRREERLWVYPRQAAHAKLYTLERSSGSYLLAGGSANMTKNSWARPVNHMVWLEARRSDSAVRAFWNDYTFTRDDYSEPFLAGLTEQLKEAQTESEKEAVIRQWVAGRDSGRNRKHTNEIFRSVAADYVPGGGPEVASLERAGDWGRDVRDRIAGRCGCRVSCRVLRPSPHVHLLGRVRHCQ